MDGAAFIPKIPEMLVVVLGLHDLRYENTASDQGPTFSRLLISAMARRPSGLKLPKSTYRPNSLGIYCGKPNPMILPSWSSRKMLRCPQRWELDKTHDFFQVLPICLPSVERGGSGTDFQVSCIVLVNIRWPLHVFQGGGCPWGGGSSWEEGHHFRLGKGQDLANVTTI